MAGIYSQLAELIAANRPACMATVLSGDRLGAKLVISSDGPMAGGINPALDNRIATDALQMLKGERNETLTYQLGDEAVEVFIETFPPPQRLIIVGAVHVAIPLHRLAKMLGYHVTVIDARGVLATQDRFPQADAIVEEWPDEAMGRLGLDSGTSVVVLTHDPKFDYPALATALRSDARYIGAIGSRTTNNRRMAALREMGFSDDELARIYAPVGLDIGAQTPAEIALAVMAEVVASRRHRQGGHLSGKPAPEQEPASASS